jgi:hypothetical protein
LKEKGFITFDEQKSNVQQNKGAKCNAVFFAKQKTLKRKILNIFLCKKTFLHQENVRTKSLFATSRSKKKVLFFTL